MSSRRRDGFVLVVAAACCATMPPSPARAASDAQMDQVEKQIRALEGQMQKMRADLSRGAAQLRRLRADAVAARTAQPITTGVTASGTPIYLGPGRGTQYVATGAPNTSPAGSPIMNVFGTPHRAFAATGLGSFQIGDVAVTLGGFLDATAVYRTIDQSLDNGTDFNGGIVYPNAVNQHEGEFRLSARSTRLSILVQGNPTPVTNIAGFYDMDFYSSGTSSTPRQSNSYTLRVRNAYGTFERKDLDLKILAGQSWSLVTPYKIGLSERYENVPIAIDQTIVVGFSYARQAQIRIVKGFDQSRYHLALSFEEPQTVFYVGPNGAAPARVGTVTNAFPGSGSSNSTYNYSDEVAPDTVLKVAADPGYGHYELFGLLEIEHNRVSHVGSGDNNNVAAGGGGGSVLLPIVAHRLDFTLNALAGTGIGRYGPALLPDATVDANGKPVPLPELMGLVGLIWHPASAWDFYGYGGMERSLGARAYESGGKGYGYGSPLYSNAGCETELSPLACTANTRQITEGTVGGYYRPIHGSFGTVQTGLQYEYIRRSIYAGIGGAPHADISVVMMSLRYLPFQ